MTTACPNCGSYNICHSHLRTPAERLGSLFGMRRFRCRECRARFAGRAWDLSDLRYVRCPKCLRPDLSLWSESHYRVSASKGLLLFLGARPYRCEYCRHNFVSFRRRKERYQRKKRMETDPNASVAEGAEK